MTGSSSTSSPGIVRVQLDGTASNPLVPGSPPIQYQVSIVIDFNKGTFVGGVNRTDFPSFQLFIDNKNIYNHVEVGTPLNLTNKTADFVKGTDARIKNPCP